MDIVKLLGVMAIMFGAYWIGRADGTKISMLNMLNELNDLHNGVTKLHDKIMLMVADNEKLINENKALKEQLNKSDNNA